MKVSAISLALVASMATSANAYPGFFADLINDVAGNINTATGLNLGSGNGAKLGNQMTSGFKNLQSIVNNIEPAKLQALGQQIQWGIGNVTQIAKEQNIPLNKAPDSIVNAKWNDLTADKIYEAFSLSRDTHVTKRGLGIKVWGPAENEAHPYIPPGPGDLRGPCPGLNTAANHGYIPRNGVLNPVQFFIGTFLGLSLSPDLAAVLIFLAMVFKGDLTTMTVSIGGQSGLGGGLSQHGTIEGDASVTRNDSYLGDLVGGNGWEVVPAKVEMFKKESGANVTPLTLSQSRYRAWQESRQNNPRFDFNPWRMLVAYGESGFVMENLRGEEKVFTNEMIDCWFIQNRYPPGWSRRLVPMTIPEILAWAAVVEALKPTLPGWSFGIAGTFLPLPTIGGLSGFFTGLTGKGAPQTIKGVGCAVSGYFLGWMPSMISTIVGGFGLGGINGLGC